MCAYTHTTNPFLPYSFLASVSWSVVTFQSMKKQQMTLPTSSRTFSSDFEIAYSFTVHNEKEEVLITQRKEISAPNESDKESH